MINQPTRARNLVAECYVAGIRKNLSLSWEEMDKRSGGMISSFTYLVLFLNDQIYAADMELNEILPGDKDLYHGAVRKTYARLHKSVDSFQTVNNSYLGKEASFLMASVLSDVEEDMKPHIDKMYYAVSQILLDAGVSGNTNAIASKAAVMNMLCQVSRLMINEFGNRIWRLFGERDNRLQPLSQDKHEFLSYNLMEEVIPKAIKIDLNGDDRLERAFEAFNTKMLYGNYFSKAIDNLEKELETA